MPASSPDALLRPRSVAVIGASRKRGTIAAEVFHNLLGTGFTGVVYPVNPHADVIQSVRAYPSVRAIPDTIDLAILVVPAALFMAVAQLNRMPVGGTALTLQGGALWLAVGINFVLGALLMLGVGNYGPTFVLLSALGMDPRAAFPIMMGSGAFAALIGCLAFVKRRNQVNQPALGLAIGSIPGVLVAALLVTALPIGMLRWLVIVVVLYAAVTMLRSGRRDESRTVAP